MNLGGTTTYTAPSIMAYPSGAGTAQAQTVTLASLGTGYTLASSFRVCWLPSHSNTTSGPTLAISNSASTVIGTPTIYKAPGTTALAASDIVASTAIAACADYDGTELILENPQTAASGGSGATLPSTAHVLGSTSTTTGVAATAADVSAIAYVAGGGSVDMQSAIYSPAIVALTDGLRVCWAPMGANLTTTPTFAPNGLTAHTIVKAGGAALAASDLTTTAHACAIYNVAQTWWELQNPQTSSGGSPAFSAVGSGTNANALSVSGSLAPSGSGTIQANLINGVTVSGNPASAGLVMVSQSAGSALWTNSPLGYYDNMGNHHAGAAIMTFTGTSGTAGAVSSVSLAGAYVNPPLCTMNSINTTTPATFAVCTSATGGCTATTAGTLYFVSSVSSAPYLVSCIGN
jgi:hypothetical protein